MKYLFSFIFALAFVGSAFGQDKIYPRGRVAPSAEVLKARHAEAFQDHKYRMASLPTATPSKFDCRDMGWVPPITDQGNCGSCWLVCSTDSVLTGGFIKGGYGKNDGTFFLAAQYVMDCKSNRPCDGGDEYNVLDLCKKDGIPSLADYFAYTARQQACRYKAGTKKWKIADFGFCTPAQQDGVASTQDIKNAMVQYGVISVAVSADNWDNYSGGVFKGNSRNVDHCVALVGWDDSKGTKGAWLLRNQWGTQWGIGGYMWIEYGANSVGTEAMWVTVNALPPPPPNPPDPTPIPPIGGLQIIFPQAIPAGTYTLTTKKQLDDLQDRIKANADEMQKLLDAIRNTNQMQVVPEPAPEKVPAKLPKGPAEDKKPELPPESKAKPKIIDGGVSHDEIATLQALVAKAEVRNGIRNNYSHSFVVATATPEELRRERDYLQARLEAMSKP